MKRLWIGMMLSISMLAAGCGGTKPAAGTDVVRILNTTQQAGTVVVRTQNAANNSTGEDIVDLKSPDGLRNYLHSKFPNIRDYRARVIHQDGATSEQVITGDPTTASAPPILGATPAPLTGRTNAGGMTLPPRGCSMDPRITPQAGLNAPRANKARAVVNVGVSKMGTPYIWGHNEDRGQYGFDCSNFTAYVYHHALGYRMSGSSQTQNTSVGYPVPRSQMQTGDLLIFDNGHHVGIYAGNNQVIQEGGGLRKVGYLNIAPGKYWSNHITSVRRMF